MIRKKFPAVLAALAFISILPVLPKASAQTLRQPKSSCNAFKHLRPSSQLSAKALRTRFQSLGQAG